MKRSIDQNGANVCRARKNNPRVHFEVCKWHVEEKDPICMQENVWGLDCDIAELIFSQLKEKRNGEESN